MPKRLAVAASGTGTLFEAILQQKLPVSLFIADRPCRALQLAEDQNIPTFYLRRTFDDAFDQEEYTRNVLGALRHYNIELVAMAGYMTVLHELMFADDAYYNKILNTHPSLLPSFKGNRAVPDALAYGVKVTGFTVHWATPKLDEGEILFQAPVSVHDDDTESVLHERIKVIERRKYPKIILQEMRR